MLNRLTKGQGSEAGGNNGSERIDDAEHERHPDP